MDTWKQNKSIKNRFKDRIWVYPGKGFSDERSASFSSWPKAYYFKIKERGLRGQCVSVIHFL